MSAIPSHAQLGRPLLLRLANAARAVDVPVETMRQLIRRGAVPSVRIGGAVYIRVRDLEEIAERGLVTRESGPRPVAPRGRHGRFACADESAP